MASLPESPLPDRSALNVMGETTRRSNRDKKRFSHCEQKMIIRRDFELISQIRWQMVRPSLVMDHAYE
jgi:hypothetical protein